MGTLRLGRGTRVEKGAIRLADVRKSLRPLELVRSVIILFYLSFRGNNNFPPDVYINL
jgi:hypothetical protein